MNGSFLGVGAMKVVALVAGLVFCGTQPTEAQRTSRDRCVPSNEQYCHEVQRRETLSSISVKYYGTTRKYMDIYRANQDILRDPDRIRVGSVLIIPRPQENRTQQIRGTVKLGVGGPFEPFIYINEGSNGREEFSGYAVDVVRSAFAKLGFDVDFVNLGNWDIVTKQVREARSIQSGDIIGTFPYIPTPFREQEFLLTDVFIETPFYAFMRYADVENGDIEIINDKVDYSGLTFCKQVGYHLADTDRIQRETRNNIKVDARPGASTANCLDRLAKRDGIDVVTEVKYGAFGQLEKLYNNGIIPKETKICLAKTPTLASDNAKAVVMIGKNVIGATDLLRELNGALQEMDGRETELRRRDYFQPLQDEERRRQEEGTPIVPVCPDLCDSERSDRPAQCDEARQPINLITASFAPFSGENVLDRGSLHRQQGLATYLVSAILKDAGYDPTITFAEDFGDALRKTTATSNIGTFPWYEDDQKRAIYNYSEPFLEITTQMFNRREDNFVYKGLFDLKENMTLCMPDDWTIPEDALRARRNDSLSIKTVGTLGECMEEIAEGSSDFTLVNEYVGWEAIDQANLDRSTFCTQYPPFVVDKAHLLTVKSGRQSGPGETVIAKFDAALRAREESGLNRVDEDNYRVEYNHKIGWPTQPRFICGEGN